MRNRRPCAVKLLLLTTGSLIEIAIVSFTPGLVLDYMGSTFKGLHCNLRLTLVYLWLCNCGFNFQKRQLLRNPLELANTEDALCKLSVLTRQHIWFKFVTT